MDKKIDYDYLNTLLRMRDDLEARTRLLEERIQGNKRILIGYEKEISLLQNQEG